MNFESKLYIENENDGIYEFYMYEIYICTTSFFETFISLFSSRVLHLLRMLSSFFMKTLVYIKLPYMMTVRGVMLFPRLFFKDSESNPIRTDINETNPYVVS